MKQKYQVEIYNFVAKKQAEMLKEILLSLSEVPKIRIKKIKQ